MYNSWAEISRSAILHNLKQYQRAVGRSVEVMPIIKSNAYGHGMVEIAKIISSKVRWLGVASLGEALELRTNNIRKRILVVSYAQGRYLEKGIKQNIDLPVYNLSYAKLLSKVAVKIKKTAKVHVKIDTGTSRIGVLTKDALKFIRSVNDLPNLKIEGVWSHFAASEDNQLYTKKQLKEFNTLLADLGKEGIKAPYIHFACSAATLVEPKAHFNMIRLGVSLYGLWPSERVKKIALKNYHWFSLKPALTWKAKIIQVKEISKGTKVSYGCTYAAKKKIKMAVLAVGYWEGYNRLLSNRGEVIVKGKRCPVIGRVCMNLTMIDVSKVKNVKAGDEVTLLGGLAYAKASTGKGVSAEELAEKIETINYEVVTNINPLLERKYLK